MDQSHQVTHVERLTQEGFSPLEDQLLAGLTVAAQDGAKAEPKEEPKPKITYSDEPEEDDEEVEAPKKRASKKDEPTIEESVQILKGLRSRYEDHHQIKYDDQALDAAAKLANRSQDPGAASGGAAIVDRQPPIDDGHEVENLTARGPDRPADCRAVKAAPERRKGRQSMNNIPEGAQADDQEVIHF